MRVLGIDPGTTRIGIGIVDMESNRFSVVHYGIISTPGKDKPSDYRIIADGIAKIVTEYRPDRAGIEKLFFSNNQKTAMAVSEARGVIILSLSTCGVPIIEFTPLQIKQAVSGYGKADKPQVQKMVRMILSIKTEIKPDDAADALAIAICCANTKIY